MKSLRMLVSLIKGPDNRGDMNYEKEGDAYRELVTLLKDKSAHFAEMIDKQVRKLLKKKKFEWKIPGEFGVKLINYSKYPNIFIYFFLLLQKWLKKKIFKWKNWSLYFYKEKNPPSLRLIHFFPHFLLWSHQHAEFLSARKYHYRNCISHQWIDFSLERSIREIHVKELRHACTD